MGQLKVINAYVFIFYTCKATELNAEQLLPATLFPDFTVLQIYRTTTMKRLGLRWIDCMDKDYVKRSAAVLVLLLCLHGISQGQQIADTTYQPILQKPEYPAGRGPVVFIDEGHHNFHTKDGRYRAFALLLERDGYVVESYTGTFEKNKLNQGEILVISNALNERNLEEWKNPTYSAFTDEEINELKDWVEQGGSLFLIADHMPMAGAAEKLAATFDYKFTNGFVLKKGGDGIAYFRRSDNTLKDNLITRGRSEEEAVREVVSFTGQGFQQPEGAEPILIFASGFRNILPKEAWHFTKKTPSRDAEGWCQGAFQKVGKGRIVFFGEAAMFTAQLVGPEQRKGGMNNTIASENYRLLLNIIHWLDGNMDE